MPTYYFSDTQLTNRLSDLTGTTIASTSDRTELVRLPAAAWVDSVFPYASPFADIAADPTTPTIIQMGALSYGLYLARQEIAKDPNDKIGLMHLKNAKDLFHVDKETGLARVSVSGASSRAVFVDLTRSRPAEEDDDRENQNALWP